MECTNKVFSKLRESFMQDLYKVNKSFSKFDSNSLFVYLMSMKDASVFLLSCKYLYDINTLLDDYLQVKQYLALAGLHLLLLKAFSFTKCRCIFSSLLVCLHLYLPNVLFCMRVNKYYYYYYYYYDY